MSRRMIVFVSPFRLHVPPHDRVRLSIRIPCPAARSCSSLHSDSHVPPLIVFVSPFKFHVRCVVAGVLTVLCCFSLRRLWHIRCLSTAATVSTLRRHVSAVIRLGLLRFEGRRARCCRPLRVVCQFRPCARGCQSEARWPAARSLGTCCLEPHRSGATASCRAACRSSGPCTCRMPATWRTRLCVPSV